METVLLHKSAFLYVTSIFRLSSFVFANALLTGITKTFVPFYSSFPEIYYNIGRILPFTAQRFPDGRVSDWYRNQYVQVVKVEPHGRFGKYGKVYGYYFRNGERADSSDSPENSWCKKDDTEPKEIPCCGCGSWFLLDIQGEPIEGNEVKVLGLDDIFTFGKYKDKTIKEVIDTDWNYVKWAIIDSQRLIADIEMLL